MLTAFLFVKRQGAIPFPSFMVSDPPALSLPLEALHVFPVFTQEAILVVILPGRRDVVSEVLDPLEQIPLNLRLVIKAGDTILQFFFRRFPLQWQLRGQ